jgi:hypothetical protein
MVRLNEVIDVAIDKEAIKQELRNLFHYEGDLTIDDSGLISVDGNVFRHGNNGITKILPIKFKSIFGEFDCSHMGLESFQNTPRYIQRDFECSNNKLTSLDGAPKVVRGTFWTTGNPIKSLSGIPEQIHTLQLCWDPDLPLLRLVGYENKIYLSGQPTGHPITKIIGKYSDNSRSNILKCQKELIDNGFEGNAAW